MKKTEQVIEVLNDLILINNDRISGYEKAAYEIRDKSPNMQELFLRLAGDSRAYVRDLHAKVLQLGGLPQKGTSTAGKLYRGWMDMKAAFTGNDAHAILESCERGEDATQETYEDAMEIAKEFPADVKIQIEIQKKSLKASHDLIRKYRNSYIAVK